MSVGGSRSPAVETATSLRSRCGTTRLCISSPLATSGEAATRRWTSNNYARSVLYNGLGRYDAAQDAAWEAFQPDPIGYGSFLVPELAEAASRTGDRALLESALEWLAQRTRVISS